MVRGVLTGPGLGGLAFPWEQPRQHVGLRHVPVDAPPWPGGDLVPHVLPDPDAGVRHVPVHVPPRPGTGPSGSMTRCGNSAL